MSEIVTEEGLRAQPERMADVEAALKLYLGLTE